MRPRSNREIIPLPQATGPSSLYGRRLKPSLSAAGRTPFGFRQFIIQYTISTPAKLTVGGGRDGPTLMTQCQALLVAVGYTPDVVILYLAPR